ncbi:hypothetical protein [Flexivirga alba]|uniref:Uncharacterized protein n=1 Tax=Flexivirga alba TaxID=702742 RepID=A0ABW2ABB7_9MICO
MEGAERVGGATEVVVPVGVWRLVAGVVVVRPAAVVAGARLGGTFDDEFDPPEQPASVTIAVATARSDSLLRDGHMRRERNRHPRPIYRSFPVSTRQCGRPLRGVQPMGEFDSPVKAAPGSDLNAKQEGLFV